MDYHTNNFDLIDFGSLNQPPQIRDNTMSLPTVSLTANPTEKVQGRDEKSGVACEGCSAESLWLSQRGL
jgi:hypothetical protein